MPFFAPPPNTPSFRGGNERGGIPPGQMETTGFSPAGFIALAVFSLDRFTKIAALKILDLGQSVRAIPGVLRITLVLNDGAAFGLFKGRAAFFVFISLAVIIAIVAYIIKSRPLNRPISIGLGLILGGALGNLADRIVLGKVVDFIDFGIWPVFNIADSCITIGAAVLVFSMLAKSSKRKA